VRIRDDISGQVLRAQPKLSPHFHKRFARAGRKNFRNSISRPLAVSTRSNGVRVGKLRKILATSWLHLRYNLVGSWGQPGHNPVTSRPHPRYNPATCGSHPGYTPATTWRHRRFSPATSWFRGAEIWSGSGRDVPKFQNIGVEGQALPIQPFGRRVDRSQVADETSSENSCH
jgi:hypothetical protein